jgi:hypothetical protein
MTRVLLTVLSLGLFAAALTGCHASGDVDGTSTIASMK